MASEQPFETILFRVEDGHTAVITMNRPERLNASNDLMRSELGQAWALVRDDPRAYLDRVRCPAAVAWGARDRLTPLEDGFELARGLDAPLRVLPGVGHLVVAECPGEVASLALRFLDGIR